LCAVFIPTAFISGLTGQFYKQFAMTIAISTVISAFNSLTLSPALSAVLLTAHHAPKDRLSKAIDWVFGGFFRVFNRTFAAAAGGYVNSIRRILRAVAVVLFIYVGLIALTGYGFQVVPTGFIPDQDKQFIIAVAQLPNGASLDRTSAVVDRMVAIAIKTPGVADAVAFAGLSINGFANSSNAGLVFLPLKPFHERTSPDLSAVAISARINQKFSTIQDGFVFALCPPPILGLGQAGGFKVEIEDTGNVGLQQLDQVTQDIVNKARALPELNPRTVFTGFTMQVPAVNIAVDRAKVKQQDVALSEVFATLSTYLGSTYADDFTRFGRTYQVNLQADERFRIHPEDIGRLKVRSLSGAMVPLSTLITCSETSGTDLLQHYNTHPAAAIYGAPNVGYSSDQARFAMQRLIERELPRGMSFEWTEITYQQDIAGNTMIFIFPLCVLVVFLVLSAFYESWSLPLVILLIVPMCLLCAITGVYLTHGDNNIFTQIGFIVLVGLACKNAILIVEFARDKEKLGATPLAAALEACRLRLRPILMTSIAFIVGVFPLVISTGAGAETRRALGIAVFSGMVGVTFFGLLLTPVFYVTARRLLPGKRGGKDEHEHEHEHDSTAALATPTSPAAATTPELAATF
jgi:multidrug efflux pump